MVLWWRRGWVRPAWGGPGPGCGFIPRLGDLCRMSSLSLLAYFPVLALPVKGQKKTKKKTRIIVYWVFLVLLLSLLISEHKLTEEPTRQPAWVHCWSSERWLLISQSENDNAPAGHLLTLLISSDRRATLASLIRGKLGRAFSFQGRVCEAAAEPILTDSGEGPDQETRGSSLKCLRWPRCSQLSARQRHRLLFYCCEVLSLWAKRK